MPKRETYPEARLRLFRELSALGFEVKVTHNLKRLKVPHVTIHGLPTMQLHDGTHVGDTKREVYFHTQAVYLDDLSMGVDIRGMSADTLCAIVTETHKRRLNIGR